MILLALIGLAAFLFYFLQQRVYIRWWNRNLLVAIGFNKTSLFEGEEGELFEVVENRKALPLPMLKVKFRTDRSLVFADTAATQVTDQYYRSDVFHVGSRERITRTLSFFAQKRGYYKINGIDIISMDLFLACSMMESRDTSKSMYVYPKPYHGEEFRLSLQQLSGEVLTKRHMLEDPFEFRGVRPYQTYDELRHVNWKATAKTRELKVNQKNYTSLKTVRIFFNVEDTGIRKKSKEVETALQIVAGLAEFYLIRGMRVACYGNGRDIAGGEPVQIEASAGSGHMGSIYKALARVDLKQNAADFGQYFRHKLFYEDNGVITFFVAPNTYDDFTGLVCEYKSTGADFAWFYPSEEKTLPDVPRSLHQNIRILSPLR